MHRIRRLVSVLLSAALFAASLPAAAQSDSEKKIAAEALFQQAKVLGEKDNWAEACPKFEESQRLEPSLGTLFYLADCYEHVGRTATAWATFLEVVSKARAAGEKGKAEFAQKRADALAPKLSKLTIAVTEPVPPDLEVRRGDVVVGRASLGAPVPVDPGTYTISASAKGKKTWSKSVVVGKEQNVAETIPPLEEATTETPAPAKPEAPKSDGATQRTIGYAVGGVGLIAIGLGAYLGLSAKSKYDDSASHCGSAVGGADGQCDPRGLELRRDAGTRADVATVLFIGGGVALAAAAVIVIAAPKNKPESPSVALTLGPLGVGVVGVFF